MQIVADNQLINYEDQGSGKVLLLLHGWGANLKTFDTMAKQLVKKYRVVRLDFPGFGGSSIAPETWALDDYATLTSAFLKKLKITHVDTVIAHSFGGRVIIKMIGEDYMQPNRIILLDAGGIKHSASLRNQGFKVIAKAGGHVTKLPGLRQFHSALRRKLYQSAGSTDYIEAGALQQIFLRVIDEDTRELAAKTTQPTLIIWGEDDLETPLSDAKIFQEKIINSKLIIVPQAGHFAYLDQPEKVMSEIETFLS